MNALTPWNPLKDMDELQRRFASFFDRIPMRRTSVRNEDETMRQAEWAPLVDISEDDKEYLIKAELPDVKRSDVKLTVENGALTISGDRHSEKEEKTKRYHRIERSYGRFERTFAVPDDADPAKVSAEFKDGLLLVHLAKSENAKPKQIEVKVS
jgi:HSP20 family protein